MARLDLELHGFFWSAVSGGEVAGRRWLAGGWSRLPAVRRAGRSLLVAREDRGASPSYQRPWPPAPGKPCYFSRRFEISLRSYQCSVAGLGVGLGKQKVICKKPPCAAFVAVWSRVVLASWCTDTTLQAQPEGAASPCNNQTSRCTQTFQLNTEMNPNTVGPTV